MTRVLVGEPMTESAILTHARALGAGKMVSTYAETPQTRDSPQSTIRLPFPRIQELELNGETRHLTCTSRSTFGPVLPGTCSKDYNSCYSLHSESTTAV